MFELYPTKGAGFYLIFSIIGCGFLTASSMSIAPVKYVWNASDSLPIGLYRITNSLPTKGELVLVRVPKWVQFLADQRKYLPRNTPAIKRIYAAHGDVVCRFNKIVSINRKVVVVAKSHDHSGRKMPQWNGCKRIRLGEVFLLADHPDSFDGRYFGIVNLIEIIGVAKPFWLIAD